MKPPLRPIQRNSSGLQTTDAEALSDATAVGESLPDFDRSLQLDFADRVSRYSRGAVQLSDAWKVLAPVLTARSAWCAADGYMEQQTLVPSAGARHPLTALLLHRAPGELNHRAWAISPSVNPLRFEITDRPAEVDRLLQATSHAVHDPIAPSTVVVVLARFRRTLSKYPDGQSLIWRDAGAFLATSHLIAATLGLRSCIVGITETTRFRLRGTADELVDVGALTLSGED